MLRTVRRPLFRCHVAAAALCLFASLAHGRALELEGQVIAVHDGDTVTLLDGRQVQHRVRIAGIDAPERGQPFGTSARENLARLVHGRRVEAQCHKRDRFGRDVCSVFVEARDVGLEQVRDGLAWWYREYAREQRLEDRANYEAAEGEARSARRGLWRDPNPQAPWAWRRQNGPGRKAAPV
jgi:endonuclease YncB( thermonuclease family)